MTTTTILPIVSSRHVIHNRFFSTTIRSATSISTSTCATIEQIARSERQFRRLNDTTNPPSRIITPCCSFLLDHFPFRFQYQHQHLHHDRTDCSFKDANSVVWMTTTRASQSYHHVMSSTIASCQPLSVPLPVSAPAPAPRSNRLLVQRCKFRRNYYNDETFQ